MKKILYVATEALPFASSGGLGDVIGSLPIAVKKASPEDDVRVVLPLYSAVSGAYREKMKKECEFDVSLSWRRQYAGLYSYVLDGVIYYFIDNEYYFKRNSLYGDFDDGERFAYFCSAVLKMMEMTDFFPDVLHANDWQSALSVIYLKTKYNNWERYRDIKTVFSIHNIAFQGKYSFDILEDVFGLGQADRGIVEYSGCINLMKGAIVCCDVLMTVSEKYAEEIQSSAYAHGLEYMTRQYAGKTCGVLNGIDMNYYDPNTDTAITKNYTYRSSSRKADNKLELQKSLGLPERADVPMISVISRLTEQKGLDLVKAVIDEVLTDDIQLVILGKGDYEYEDFFYHLQERHPDKVRTLLLYNKDLSKKIYASSDVFLMPSKTEPCGLSQMIASRYGAIPVVRETGGLYDSIKPYIEHDDGTFEGDGFTFANYNAHDMMYTLRLAISLYRDEAKRTELVKKIMRRDFSWGVSAVKYLEIYNQLMK